MSKASNSEIISRKPFDLQEAVVLLDVYLSFNKKGSTNIEAAEVASQRLRDLACKRGMVIDDSFRSTMGIQNRLRSIGYIYEGMESASAPGTQVFREAVDLYKNFQSKYKDLLKDASVSTNFTLKNSGCENQVIPINNYKDKELKEWYGEVFFDVYYTFKQVCKKDCSGVTVTDLLVQFSYEVNREDISNILDNASWSKKVSDTHYIFLIQEQEERKPKQVEEIVNFAEQEFMTWLSNTVSFSTLEEVKNSFKIISAMLVQKKILPQSLIATTRIEQIENALQLSKKRFASKKLRNDVQKLLSAYLIYLSEKENVIPAEKQIQDIDVQEDWIRFDFTNSIKFERTVPVYCSIKGQKLEGKNWARILVEIVEKEVSRNNTALETLYGQPLISSRKDQPFFLKKKIEGMNCAELSNGYWLNVNYNIPCLMDQIQALCLRCGYSKTDVVIYGVSKGGNAGLKASSGTPRNTWGGVSIEQAESYLVSVGLQGATIQTIIDNVQPGAVISSTRNMFESSINVIAMPENRYVHVNTFMDLDEAEEGMRHILRMQFARFNGYSNNKLLFGAASHELSLFLNDNDCQDVDSVYALARYFFEKKNTDEKYMFSYPHIFEKIPDYPPTQKGLMINFARMNGGVLNVEDARNYLEKIMFPVRSINRLLQISSSHTFLLYDTNRYILSDKMGIDTDWIQTIHDHIDNLFCQADVAYIIPRDIRDTWMDTLPSLPQGLRWTILLLQEVLRNYPDIGFRPITSELAQTHDTIAAAFVPVSSPLQSFSDVVTLYMQDKYTLPKRMACEELRQILREAGMLEGNELIYALPKALDDFRFSWTDENRMVLVRGY